MQNRDQWTGDRGQGSCPKYWGLKRKLFRSPNNRESSPHSFVVKYIFLLLFPVLFPLSPVSCSLFNAPQQDDYFKKIDEEIAWANATRLTVNVAFPPEWGGSPQAGVNRCFDEKRANETPRAGIPLMRSLHQTRVIILSNGWPLSSQKISGWNQLPALNLMMPKKFPYRKMM